MPSKPHRFERACRLKLDQRLRRTGYQQDGAVVENKPVTVVQIHRFGKVEQKFPAPFAVQNDAPAPAIAPIKTRSAAAVTNQVPLC